MKYNVVSTYDVANSIINRARLDKEYITPLKLNCLVYLLYMNYLYLSGDKLFGESFLITKEGPLLESLQFKFGCYKNKHIKNYAIDACNKISCASGLSFDICLENIWFKYKSYSDSELLNFVIRENGAFYNSYSKGSIVVLDQDIIDEKINENANILNKAKELKKIL